MAESVDALVSNTSGFTSIPVRPRVWVQKRRKLERLSPFFVLISFCWLCSLHGIDFYIHLYILYTRADNQHDNCVGKMKK